MRALALFLLVARVAARDPVGVLQSRCAGCHGAARISGLDLRTREGALRGGTRGAALVPGDAANSRLYRMAAGLVEPRMPPAGAALSKAELDSLKSWIDRGAPWSESPETLWWSFRTVVRPTVSAGAANPVDAFVSAALRKKGLAAAPRADRLTLIRRAYFDLVGLPPPPERVNAFLADTRPDAYAALIDELLASPHYGERWARHWLDVVRYADSGGYETDILFKNAWRYRDYTIAAFNSDKPYDEFVREQIAGDELYPDNLDLDGSYTIPEAKMRRLAARIATGMYTLGPEVHESNMDARKLNYEKLTDMVDTTGSAFLGLTFACARCHDHKFDPISQRDYYRLQAVFAFSAETDIPVVHRMSIRDHGQHYPRVIAVAEARIAYRLHEKRMQEKKARGAEQAQADKDESSRLLAEIGRAVLAVPEKDAQGTSWDGLMDIPIATVLGHRAPELVPETFTLSRGEIGGEREKVAAGLPLFLGGGDVATADCTGRCVPLARKQLALWLTSGSHPLTARVMVNRIWAWHFGAGIVATPNDFGRQGQPPVFPELLDWLAAEFVERGWSVKAMHRLMMTSEAYMRSSRFAPVENLRADPDNSFLWRANRRRLEGEILWDAMHAAAGTLNARIGGRPFAPPLSKDEAAGAGNAWQWPVNADPAEHSRRGLYILVRRTLPYPMFEAFDSPTNAVSCPRREVSSVAPQALWFLNHRVAHGQAARFAERLRREFGTSAANWVEPAWRWAIGRPPTEEETKESLRLIESLSLDKFCLSLFNLNEFAFVD